MDEVRERWQALLRDPMVCVGVSEDAAGLTSLVAFDDGVVRHLAVRPDRWGTGTARAAMEWATVGHRSNACGVWRRMLARWGSTCISDGPGQVDCNGQSSSLPL